MKIVIFRFLLIVSFTLSCSIKVYCQDWTPQFYHSDFKPRELNIPSEERLKALYDYYSQANQNEAFFRKRDYRNFVYRVNYYSEMLNRSGMVFYGDSLSIYLNQLKDFILKDHPMRSHITVYLTRFPSVNAFANDFGQVYVNLAAFAYLDSEDELLALLAHELAHIILKHMHKYEVLRNEKIKAYLKNEQTNSGLTRDFSWNQEREADLLAVKMLDNLGVDLSSALKLYQFLLKSNDPCISTSVRLRDMAAKDTFLLDYLGHLQRTGKFHHKDIADSNDIVSETHPGEIERITLLNDYIKTNRWEYSSNRKQIGHFGAMQKLAREILVDIYTENGLYINGLDLVIKLRQADPDNPWLVKAYAKLLVVGTHNKYISKNKPILLNTEGFQFSDTSFIEFKELLLAMGDVEFNLVSLLLLKEFIALYNFPFLEKYHSVLLEYLFIHNKDLFTKDEEGHQFLSDTLIKELISPSKNLIFDTYHKEMGNTRDEDDFQIVDFADEIKFTSSKVLVTTEGFVYIKKRNRKEAKDLIMHYSTSFPLTALEKEVVSRCAEKGASQPKMQWLKMDPDTDFKTYRSIQTTMADSFDDQANSLMIKSYNYHLYKRYGLYFVDYKKTLEMEKFVTEIFSNDSVLQYNLSNLSVGQTSVADNYSHYCLSRWTMEYLDNDPVRLSVVDEQIEAIMEKQPVRYGVLNINIVVGARFPVILPNKVICNYIYFDLQTGEIVYTSTVASRLNFSRPMFRQLLF
jgi:hypothetical protein